MTFSPLNRTSHNLHDFLSLRTSAFRSRCSAAFLAAAGIAFAVYPALRPFSDESTLQGAAAFASSNWLSSHLIAIFAFIFMTFGLYGVYAALQRSNAEGTAFHGLILSWLGTGLTLPFYGAEVFGLHVIGKEAIKLQNSELLELASEIRFGPGFIIIVIGLILLAFGTIMIALAIWKSRLLSKWSGIPLAVGILLYLPQFTVTQPLRVAHGMLITAGCIWMAISTVRHFSRGVKR